MIIQAPFTFLPPADQQDFAESPAQQAAFDAQWNTNLVGFSNQGIVGNPWTSTNASNQTSYFNPSTTTPPGPITVAPIEWNAFPGRIQFYYNGILSPSQQLELADTGYYTDGNGNQQTFPPITSSPCDPNDTRTQPYGPYGPRGWLDEYCEWTVERDGQGNIVRVDFTCENPEYWNTLWMIDPDQVAALYSSTLGKTVVAADLCLTDGTGAPVIDPSTGRPAYNPLNKWNAGTVSTARTGGAMHLTSTPNTIQTEINLAASATVQRNCCNTNPGELICCSQYGQPHRNSDPNIGFSVNQLVSLGNALTLTNPPGLYIQMPNFNTYAAPHGDDPSQYWTIVRGVKTLNAQDGTALPGNYILHATYAVPASKGYTVSDITINGQPIAWGGQIAQTFSMHINGTVFAAPAPTAEACVGTPSPVLPMPNQMFYSDVFWGYYNTPVSNPVGVAMNVASNSTFIAPLVEQGAQNLQMVFTVSGATTGTNGQLPAVGFDGDDLTATVAASGSYPPISQISYAVPGNSYPSAAQALQVNLNVSATARLGLRTVFITNSGGPSGPGVPALINVVPAGTIGARQTTATAAATKASGHHGHHGHHHTSHRTLRATSNLAAMVPASSFSPPADQQDFSNPVEQETFNALWSSYLEACTQQAIVGNPWTVKNDNNRYYYFDPTKVAATAAPTPVEWGAFPNRLNVYFGTGSNNPYQLQGAELWELADTGKVASVPAFQNGFAQVTDVICPAIDWSRPQDKWQAFGPPGPRGWMDEYCEWSVTRNTAGDIVRVDFTCENPEYWLNAWRVDPNVVLGLYQTWVNSDVQLGDLYLTETSGKPVVDPTTGLPAYNPLNKWNNGTSSTAGQGGAMHLTSPPNTLGAEVYLAAAATILRTQDANPQQLVCCAQYGQPYRNSDPNIGFSVNGLVSGLNDMVTLSNPIGLYLQMPNPNVYTFPEGYSLSDFVTVARGRTAAQAGTAYDQILHMVFAPPAALAKQGFTLAGVSVNGQPIQWGAQITETFNMALAATAIPSTVTQQTQLPCPKNNISPNPWPQGLIPDVLLGNYIRVDGISELPPILPPVLVTGQTIENLTLVCVDAAEGASITFPGGGITATVTRSYPLQGTAHGTTKLYDMYAFVLTVTVAANAPLGLQGIQVVNPDRTAGPTAAAVLCIVAASTGTAK